MCWSPYNRRLICCSTFLRLFGDFSNILCQQISDFWMDYNGHSQKHFEKFYFFETIGRPVESSLEILEYFETKENDIRYFETGLRLFCEGLVWQFPAIAFLALAQWDSIFQSLCELLANCWQIDIKICANE